MAGGGEGKHTPRTPKSIHRIRTTDTSFLQDKQVAASPFDIASPRLPAATTAVAN